MKPAFEDLSPEAMAMAIEQNGFAFFLSTVTPLHAEIYEDTQLLRVITRVPFSPLNVILRANFEPAVIESKVEAVLADFGEPRLPLTWWIGPATLTPELGKTLLAHGLAHAGDTPGMAINLRDLQVSPSLPAQFTLTPVTDLEGIERWVQTYATCSGFNEQAEHLWQTIHRHVALKHATSSRYYVGWLNGKPVATSLLFFHNGVAGIYHVATLPEHRGQGIGTAMTSLPLREALEQGYRLGVLESSQMGFSLYQRLGFQQYCTLSAYVWPA